MTTVTGDINMMDIHKSFALLMIVSCDYQQIVLSPTDPLEIDFRDILL